jgi:mitochondrial fission protein ELM1
VAHYVRALVLIFRPLLYVTRAVSGLLRRGNELPVTSIDEIRLLAMLGRTSGALAARTAAMIEGAAALRELTAYDIMVPRAGIAYLSGTNTLEENLTLVRRTGHSRFPEALAKAGAEWADRFETAAPPRIAVLVGGTSGQYRLDAATARRLGAACAQLARRCGGSLLATTSRRLGAAATDAFCEAIGETAWLHRWRPDDPENPYLGLLAHADAFVITGDSESMLAEAASLGKPLAIFPLPVRRSFRALSAFREWVWRRATAKPAGARGTPRPQRGLERWCGKAIERGFVRPTRDLDLLHASLFARGLARPFDGFDPTAPPPRGREGGEARRVADAVRALMGVS